MLSSGLLDGLLKDMSVTAKSPVRMSTGTLFKDKDYSVVYNT